MATNIFELKGVTDYPGGIDLGSYTGGTGNGVPIGTKFTLSKTPETMFVKDDDGLLEDNNGTNKVDGGQSKDSTLQVLDQDFKFSKAGDLVWSRAWQTIEDSEGNIGRIYQIRVGTPKSSYNPNDPRQVVDYNVTNLRTYFAFSGDIKLNENQTYTVKSNFAGNGNQDYASLEKPAPCFVRGSQIETIKGYKAVEELKKGDMVRTKDNGFQPIKWIGSSFISSAALKATPKVRPVRVSAGAFGNGLPERDLLLSPQHRVLVSSKIAERIFGEREVLAPIGKLSIMEGIDYIDTYEDVEYFHFLFDQHEVVYSEGLEVESLYTGPEALRALDVNAREEILFLFPELAQTEGDDVKTPARKFADGRKVYDMALRHWKNEQTLFEV